jgi:hypothetical protein
MADPVIRPRNAVLLVALQSAESTAATPNPATDAVPFEDGSFTFNSPYRTEDSSEVNGSFVGSAPLVLGQAATVSFRSRLKGAGAGVTYTSSVKPPLHAPLQACGMRGQFTASVSAAALTAGTPDSATLGTGFAATAQQYRGMPLLLTAGPGAGRVPLIVDYSSAKVASLSDIYGAALTTSTIAGLPANWSYAGTSPADNTARLTDQPCATIYYYEDGRLYRWMDCRGVVDFDGNSAQPGFGAFSFTGVFVDVADAAVPNAVIAGHSAPLLLQGSGVAPAMQANRRGLPISRWSLSSGGATESSEDPNTSFGFGAAQIGARTPIFEADPLQTLIATRNALAEIAAYSVYPISLQFGATAGNRVSLLLPQAQPIEAAPGLRGTLRSETLRYQALNPGDDAYARDGERILTFS